MEILGGSQPSFGSNLGEGALSAPVALNLILLKVRRDILARWVPATHYKLPKGPCGANH